MGICLRLSFNFLLKLKRIVNEFKKIANQTSLNAEKFVGNPVNSFLLIKQVDKELQNFVNILNPSEKLQRTKKNLSRNFICALKYFFFVSNRIGSRYKNEVQYANN